ncbi:MAG: LLM class F420-dependent oxidoreductase [Dehalococcoidia bacterium]
MKLGITVPNIELGIDPEPIRALACGAERLGFDYLMFYDHVIGADKSTRPDWRPFKGHPPIYDIDDSFHEAIVLCGFVAAITQKIGLATGVIVAPQRQTVLLAKQIAEVDVLSRGRMRLGIGVGWNDLECAALGSEFKSRGPRMTEQVEVMRRLWTQRSVTFHGQWHDMDAMGICPLPIQQPIPIWLGGDADAVLRRIAAIGDGWYVPSYLNERQIRERIDKLNVYAEESGRDPKTIGIEGIIRMHGRTPERCAESLEMWSRLGATHVVFNTESDGYRQRLPSAQMEKQGFQEDYLSHDGDEMAAMSRRIAACGRFLDAAKQYIRR